MHYSWPPCLRQTVDQNLFANSGNWLLCNNWQLQESSCHFWPPLHRHRHTHHHDDYYHRSYISKSIIAILTMMIKLAKRMMIMMILMLMTRYLVPRTDILSNCAAASLLLNEQSTAACCKGTEGEQRTMHERGSGRGERKRSIHQPHVEDNWDEQLLPTTICQQFAAASFITKHKSNKKNRILFNYSIVPIE